MAVANSSTAASLHFRKCPVYCVVWLPDAWGRKDKSLARQRRLSGQDAKKRAIELWTKGWVIPTHHSRKQSLRRHVSDPDIEHAFLNGKIVKQPEWDEEHENWVYVIHGTDVEGEPLAIVFCFEDDFTELKIITYKGW